MSKPEIDFLGYHISSKGITAKQDKVDALLKIPSPQTKRQLRKILGSLQWFKRFIPNLSTLVANLTSLTKKDIEFSWNNDLQQQLDHVLSVLANKTLLTYPDLRQPFHLQTDASDIGIGSMLF